MRTLLGTIRNGLDPATAAAMAAVDAMAQHTPRGVYVFYLFRLLALRSACPCLGGAAKPCQDPLHEAEVLCPVPQWRASRS